VASRNVLVGSDSSLVKLSDLGATRVLGASVCVCFVFSTVVDLSLCTTDERDYYRKSSLAVVPLKWMAPEAIREAKYTIKSDVWAFGVLCYEVASLGMTPYGALSGQELMLELERGYRLPQPAACPSDLCVVVFFCYYDYVLVMFESNRYTMMKLCWHTDPSQRPSCFLLQEQLSGLISAPRKPVETVPSSTAALANEYDDSAV
jgi:serine/threonine protein kinase